MPSSQVSSVQRETSWARAPRLKKLLAVVALSSATLSVLWTTSVPAVAVTSTIWSSTVVPADASADDNDAVEVGTRFVTSEPASVVAIRYYKGQANRGPHTGRLWSSDGKVIASVAFTGETASGWQQARLDAPVALRPGLSYVVSYTAPAGRYAAQQDVFSNGRTLNRGSLTALSGVYSYDLRFPSATWRGSSYFVDVVAETTSQTGTTPPPTPPPTPPLTPPVSGTGNAGSTGASGVLRSVPGPITLSKDGQVLEDVAISGRVTVLANDVTLRNVKITSNDDWALLNKGRNLRVTDSTVTGTQQTQASIADGPGASSVLQRVDVSGAADGVLLGTGSQLRDSFVHDLASFAGAHNDGVVVDGSSGVRVVGNTILNQNGQTSAVTLSALPAANADVVIDHNLLAGGGYVIYGGAPAHGLTVTNNQFSTRYFPQSGYWGPVAYWDGAGNIWSGNQWSDGPDAGKTVNG